MSDDRDREACFRELAALRERIAALEKTEGEYRRILAERQQTLDALQRSEAYAQSLINSIPDLLFVLSREGVFLDYKGGEKDIYVSPDRFIGKNYRDVMPAALMEPIEEALRRLSETKQPVELEYSLPVGGKPEFYSARIVRFGDDRLIVLARNVTVQKQMERELKRTREQFELAVRGSNDGVWDWNLRDNSLYLSPKWKEQLGYRDDELENSFATFENLMHPDDRPAVLAYVERYLKGEFETYSVEFRMRHKDGSWRWILGRGAAIRGADGIPFRMAGSHTDITDRKRFEEELKFQTRLQQVLMEISTTYINLPLDRLDSTIQASLGELGEFVGADRVYLFDYDFEQEISINTHEWCADGITPQIDELQAVPFSLTTEFVETHRRGKTMYIPDVGALSPGSGLREVLEPQGIKSLLAVPMMDGEQCLGFVGFDSVRQHHRYSDMERGLLTVFAQKLVNVRKRGKIEEALKESRKEAERANQAKSEFLASMSHEIRTPLNAILGMAELLWESPLNQEQRQYVRVFRSAGEDLLALINDIIDIARVESGQFALEMSTFNLAELVGRTCEVMAARSQAKGLELVCFIHPDVSCMVSGDALRLRQILINLVGNAVKFTERGEVFVSVRNAGDDAGRPEERDPESVWLHFSVRDTGIGVPEDKREAIFDKFTQADASITRKYEGSGLGLTISRHLVMLMGGRIWVESEEGRGSTFHFTVPLSTGPGDVQELEGVCVSPDLAGLKVLVIDDSATNRFILRELLDSWGALVIEADSGAAGIAAIREQHARGKPVDLVLLDSRMPGGDGFAVAETLRGDPKLAGAAIMMLTPERSGDIARAKGLGLTNYLFKPVQRVALLEAIQFALSRKAPTPEAPPVSEGVEQPILRILLVDDSEDNRLLIQAYLKKTPSIIETAENGQVALDKFREGTFDIVLMDMQMPLMDGYTATRAIRAWEQEQRRPATPVIALTAHALKDDERKSIEAGCSAHLTKPVKKSLLLDTIRGLTGRPSGGSAGS